VIGRRQASVYITNLVDGNPSTAPMAGAAKRDAAVSPDNPFDLEEEAGTPFTTSTALSATPRSLPTGEWSSELSEGSRGVRSDATVALVGRYRPQCLPHRAPTSLSHTRLTRRARGAGGGRASTTRPSSQLSQRRTPRPPSPASAASVRPRPASAFSSPRPASAVSLLRASASASVSGSGGTTPRQRSLSRSRSLSQSQSLAGSPRRDR
jgi:hypothetical protein